MPIALQVGSSAASTASTSPPPTPLPSPLLGQPNIHSKDPEDAALVNTKGLVCGISALVIPDVQQATLKPAVPCPDSLVRNASNFVPIRLPAVCTTSETDPFGAFAKSYFADEPKASAVSADAVPDLYYLDIYALISAPLKCQRPREVKVIWTPPSISEVHGTQSADASLTYLVGPVVAEKVDTSKTIAEEKTVGPTITSTHSSQVNACTNLEEKGSHVRPQLRALLLPQEVKRRASREDSYRPAPVHGIRPLMLPLHVTKRFPAADSPGLLSAYRSETSRLSLPAAKSPASNPPPRARSFSGASDPQNSPGISVDAIEIAEKANRHSRNVADLVSLVDEFGVTGAPQSEDPCRSATVAAAGTHSAEGVRGRPEVPGREVLDDSQDKQDGTRDGGVRAAFDGTGDALRYSRKLDDIVVLLGLPEVCDAVPRVYGPEHADGVTSRENSYKWR